MSILGLYTYTARSFGRSLKQTAACIYNPHTKPTRQVRIHLRCKLNVGSRIRLYVRLVLIAMRKVDSHQRSRATNEPQRVDKEAAALREADAMLRASAS